MTTERARQLRKDATSPERILWARLRTLKKFGLHFRRQATMGAYVVDFVCHAAKLIVEVDGVQHGEPKAVAYDSDRSNFLKTQGYRVIRFWNAEVVNDSALIAEMIFEEAKASLPWISSAGQGA